MASNSQSLASANNVQPYRMHVSQRYLDLTKQKLELTRLPRDAQTTGPAPDYGVSKSDLEPLIDHWTENYDWRREEAYYNDKLPQFRALVNGTRLHFVHKKSHSPTAIPLLFVHGYPESFLAVTQVLDALCEPIMTPPRGDENLQAFHVVAPSIPGFGFSDSVSEEGNSIPTTAALFDALMKTLGYRQYMVHGSGWAFRICRMMALAHSDSCIAIHTVNPEVPAPRFDRSLFVWLKYRMAQLTFVILRRPSFGYSNDDFAISDLRIQSPGLNAPGLTPPLTPSLEPQPPGRPQTTAYALCDSPTGLLAYLLDIIHPPSLGRGSRSPQHLGPSSARQSPTLARSPSSPHSAVGTPGPARSPQHHYPSQILELPDLQNPWTPTALINWTMIYWLPGPEVALRWLINSASLVPSLWMGTSNVPLGITHFRDTSSVGPSTGTGQTPPQWAEAYHRVAMLRRREGRVRFPAWERPAEVVIDIRELADLLGIASSGESEMVANR